MPHYKLFLKSGFKFVRHGANELNPDGTVKVNHGGDVLVGYRTFDNENASLLDGIIETTRYFYLMADYEFVNNYLLRMRFDYKNESNQFKNVKDLLTSFSIIFKI